RLKGSASLLRFRLLPERFHVIEAGSLERSILILQRLFDRMKTAHELGVRPDQCLLGVNAQVPAEIDNGKQEVTEFIGDGAAVTTLHLFPKFADFLLDLVEDRSGRTPVEADPRRTVLQLERARQCGQRERDIVQISASFVVDTAG